MGLISNGTTLLDAGALDSGVATGSMTHIKTLTASSSATLSFVCLDSKFTGFSVPSKTYGIMATGTPIIGLIDPNSEIGNTIIKYNCGKIWNSGDNKSLSELLVETIENEKEIIEMRSNSSKAFSENFDLSISASKYSNLINS